MKILEYCSCGYKGVDFYRHRRAMFRQGHHMNNHVFLGWIEVRE